MVRLSELKSTAQNSRPGKTTLALPDDIITQREDPEQALGEGEDSDEQEEEEEEQGAVVPESQPRRRRPARLPEGAPRVEPEEKFRGKRQKDFDISEHTASSDEESQKRERSRTAEEPWTQNQQKLLELALQQYPKGSSDRWDKIAKCVPSKSKVGEAGRGGGLHSVSAPLQPVLPHCSLICSHPLSASWSPCHPLAHPDSRWDLCTRSISVSK